MGHKLCIMWPYTTPCHFRAKNPYPYVPGQFENLRDPHLVLLPAPEIKVPGAARMTWRTWLAGGPWPRHVFLLKVTYQFHPRFGRLWPTPLSSGPSRLVSPFQASPFHHLLHTSMCVCLSLPGASRPLRRPPSSTAVATPLWSCSSFISHFSIPYNSHGSRWSEGWCKDWPPC